MEIRYIGFEQKQSSRVYRFEVRTEGRLTKQVTVTTDIAVFRNQSVGTQEGPLLSGNKLIADLERGWEGEHELTGGDLRAYTDAKAVADAQRVGARKQHRRPGVQALQKSPWRNLGI